MSITIDGENYSVPEYPTRFRIPIVGDTTQPYRRNQPGGVPETDAVMQARVQEDVTARQRAAAAQAGNTTEQQTPKASPAGSKPERVPGTAGKPSDESAKLMPPPPAPKRQHLVRGKNGERQLQAAIANLASSSQCSAAAQAAQQRANPKAAAPDVNDMTAFPGFVPRFGAPPTFGLTAGALSSRAAPLHGSSAWSRPLLGPNVSAPPTPTQAPNLIGAASAAMKYVSPLTEPKASTAADLAKLKRDPVAKAALDLRMSECKPRGRVQRAVQLDDDDRRALEADRKRNQRATTKQLGLVLQKVMADLASYRLPLVQLLEAEFALHALECSEAMRKPGSLRTRFLAAYGATCHTKHAAKAEDIGDLVDLVRVLRAYKPARELVAERLRAAKDFVADLYSGGHRLGTITVEEGETLMQLRTRIFQRQRRSGATAKELSGISDEMLQLNASKVHGRFTLEVLSYDNARETAISGALLYMKNISRDDLTELCPAQSRSVATLHDQRFHWVQRLLTVREFIESGCLLSLIYDDASKRGRSFIAGQLIGTRCDGSRLAEVLRVARLRKDVLTDKTKSGKNGASMLMDGLKNLPGDALESILWQLQVIMCDTTGSNTGTKVLSGEGGSASHMRKQIEELTRGEDDEVGHVLIEQRDCLSHAGHNECETVMTEMGVCDENREYLSHRQEIDTSKGSKERVWMKNLLDELAEYVRNHPEILRAIEVAEGLTKRSLSMPPTGVVTRWGFYGKAAAWFTESRIEIIIQYALTHEKKIEDLDGGEVAPSERIANIAKDGVRAMVFELSNPEKRIKLLIFRWYYAHSLKPYLDFTQSKSEYQSARVHRVIRRRLLVFDQLKGPTENDAPDGPWLSQLKPLIDAFVASAPIWAFHEVNPRNIARAFFTAAHNDFHTRTRGYAEGPMSLIFSVLDEKGEAVRGAQELVDMVGASGPMVSFAKRIAYDPKQAMRKGSMHEGVTATTVVKAITHPKYKGVCLAFLPDLWKLIVALSKLPEDTKLCDVAELKPLYDFLHPLAKHAPISNFQAEEIMKVIGKSLKAQQRMSDETATLNVACACREPEKLFHLTPELDLQASRALGHNKEDRAKTKASPPDVEMHGSTVGYAADDDDVRETWGAYGSWDEERGVWDDAPEDEGETESSEEDVLKDEEVEALAARAGMERHERLGKKTAAEVRSQVIEGNIVSAIHPKWGMVYFYAEVVKLPAPGATGAGSKSVTLRWLDEVGGEGSGVYEYDPEYDEDDVIGLTNIVDTNPQLHARKAANDTKQWLTPEAHTLLSEEADETEKTLDDVMIEYPDDALVELLDSRRRKKVEDEVIKAEVHDEMKTRMDVGVRVDEALKDAMLGSSKTNSIDVDPDTIELRAKKMGNDRVLSSSRCILSNDPREWLNDAQVANLAALLERATTRIVKFNYPRAGGKTAALIFKGRRVTKTLSGEWPLSSVVQNYVETSHWQKIIVSFEEKVVYYTEPYGRALRPRHEIAKAFDEIFGSRNDGWRLVSIQLALQTDGHSCGVWAVVVDEAWVAYCDSEAFGSDGGFGKFLDLWLGRDERGVVDLNKVRGAGTAKSAAQKGNEAFIKEERVQMRARLLAAARAKKLPFTDALLDAFVAEGMEAATEGDLTALDEEEDDGEL